MVFDPVFAEDGEEEEGRLDISDSGVMLPTGAVLYIFRKKGTAWDCLAYDSFWKKETLLVGSKCKQLFLLLPYRWT